MEQINQLILAIQMIAGGAAVFRIAGIYLEFMNEDDKTMRNKKMVNVCKAVILIETVTTFSGILTRYYQ